MSYKISRIKKLLPIDIDAVTALIVRTQKKNGEIPWSGKMKTDPWDHVEAAMGLTIGGCYKEARKAFDWMAENQLDSGCWYAAYQNGVALDRTLDANLSAYIAVGVYHYYLVTGDGAFLTRMWPTVRAAIDFALSLQASGGEIHWAISPQGEIDPMALLTGSSSIFMSVKCALMVAKHLRVQMPGWLKALGRLQGAIAHKPELFNMTKARFAMDWFYPILAGAVTDTAARERIKHSWKKFVINGQGVRCVSDQDWITLAETAELSLTLSGMGNHSLAQIVFNWICDKRYDDGTYWCGYTYPDMVIWPEEKISWTNAVVLMAADALYNLTPAAGLFTHRFWETADFG
jgi:hypothetical protein